MQTHFPPERLADPHLLPLEKILRSCVHCGFCTATCPTYLITGDERESPRGRIYLIKDLLETGRAPTAEDVAPIDHCLSCLACMTTCPSGVDYRRLVDHARAAIETTYQRPLPDRVMRAALAWLLPSRALFRLALAVSAIGRPFAPILARVPAFGGQLAAMLALARKARARYAAARPGEFKAPAPSAMRRRLALLTGCAQEPLAPQINAATIRLLNRAGIDVVLPEGEGCCGSLLHHMGREARALDQARANVDAWIREADGAGLEAIVVTASGCSATIKDYGFMLRDDPAYAAKANARRLAGEGRLRISRRPRSHVRQSEEARRRLSRRLLAAARAEDPRSAQGAAAPGRLRSAHAARGPHLLRLGGHLQYPSAGNGRRAARTESRQPLAREARRHRRRQHRLPDADRLRDFDAGRPYGRTARLGERRAEAGGAGVMPHKRASCWRRCDATAGERAGHHFRA